MKLFPVIVDYDHEIDVPNVSQNVIKKFEDDGIGIVLTRGCEKCEIRNFIILNEWEDLPTIEAVLNGDIASSWRSPEETKLLRILAEYLDGRQSRQ